jgi:sodium/hydrogen antiporter
MSWNELIPSDPEINGIHVVYFFLGLFIASFGLLSLLIKDKLKMSEAMVATIFGILIGPHVLNVFDPHYRFGNIQLVILEVSRY